MRWTFFNWPATRERTATEAMSELVGADLWTLAQELDMRNRERQKIERSIAEQVIGVVRSKFNPDTDFVIVEGQLLWHVGVVGIVASRVLREFYRPTLILGGDADEVDPRLWRGLEEQLEWIRGPRRLARGSGDRMTPRTVRIRHGASSPGAS